MLLPVQDYFPGAELPAHLSPFEQKEEIYIPPEQKLLLARQRGEVPVDELQKPEDDSDEEIEEEKIELPIPKSYHQWLRERKQKWKARLRRSTFVSFFLFPSHYSYYMITWEKSVQSHSWSYALSNFNILTFTGKLEEAAHNKEMEELNSKPSSDAVKGTEPGGAEGSSETAMETNEDKEDDEEIVREVPLKEDSIEPKVMEVTKGKKLGHQARARLAEKKAQLRLSINMLPRKRRKIYWAVKRREAAQQRKAEILQLKRNIIDKRKANEKKNSRNELIKGRTGY